MDDDLRIGLWNAVYNSYSSHIYQNDSSNDIVYRTINQRNEAVRSEKELIDFASKIRSEIMRRPYDNINPHKITLKRDILLDNLKDWIFTQSWNQVYDLIEFLPDFYPAGPILGDRFRAEVNRALKRENAGYRFVGNQLVRVTAEEEIPIVEKAQRLGEPFSLASEQLKQALRLLSDRENPDYRNSIKESISAVEAACRVVSGKPKATLGDALDAIKDESAHPALREAFNKLYGWTNDAAGIRHAMTESGNVGFAEAQFMVVACSAFTYYLAAKSPPANG